MKKNRILRIIAIICIIICNANILDAALVYADKSYVKKNDVIKVTLDFGQYVAAYDSIEVTFNGYTMEYVSGDPLKETLWWDTTEASSGIKTKTYNFKAIANNGICTINIKVKGAVSANATMDPLGDININKKITIGNGAKEGDINADGLVDSADAAIALNIYKYNNATQDDITVGDLDGNDIIDSADAAIILNKYKYGN